MDSTKSVLKSLNWTRLLRKSSGDEYDSDETYCDDGANESKLESSETILHNKPESNRLESGIGEQSHDNAISDQSTPEDLEIFYSKILSRSILSEPTSYQDIDGTKHCRLPHTDTINYNNKEHCCNNKNEIEETRRDKEHVDDEITDPLENSDCSLNEEYSLTDEELDLLLLLKAIPLKEDEHCVPPLTLNRQSHQRKIPPAEKVLPWIRKRKRKMYSEKKKLPDRKCASFYIEKSNRMLEKQADCSSNSDGYQTFTDNGAKQERINEFNERKLKSPKKYFGQKRGRPCKSTNGPSTEQNVGEKGSSYSSLKVLQDLEVDLNHLKRRLSRSIDTREEAFQMLSHVQTITKTLRFHLDRVKIKTKKQKNKRKFLLRYLAQQISKSEELEKFLDNAIAEADRLTQMETSEDATSFEEESTDSVTENNATEHYNIREEKSNIKTILRHSKYSSEFTNSSSEPRHISFSDEVECRYLSCSTQSSNSREAEQYENQTDQENGNNITQNLSGIDVFGGNYSCYGEVSKTLFCQNTFSDSEAQGYYKAQVFVSGAKCPNFVLATPGSRENKNLQLLKKQLRSIKVRDNTNSDESNRIQGKQKLNQELIERHSLQTSLPKPDKEPRYILERDEKNKINTALQISIEDVQSKRIDSINGKCLSKENPNHNINPPSIGIVDNVQSQNSEIVNPPCIQISEDFTLGNKAGISDIKSKNSASSKLFQLENSENVNPLSIQMSDDFKFEHKDSISETNRQINPDSEQLQLENSENQTEDYGAFGFSELQSSLTQGAPNWMPYTMKDIKAVRTKDPSEFIDLDELTEGAMDSPDWFDFDWKY